LKLGESGNQESRKIETNRGEFWMVVQFPQSDHSSIRNPNIEEPNKSEARSLRRGTPRQSEAATGHGMSSFGIWVIGACFGFRYSDFGFDLPLPLSAMDKRIFPQDDARHARDA
jgi:hypothetical protein